MESKRGTKNRENGAVVAPRESAGTDTTTMTSPFPSVGSEASLYEVLNILRGAASSGAAASSFVVVLDGPQRPAAQQSSRERAALKG